MNTTKELSASNPRYVPNLKATVRTTDGYFSVTGSIGNHTFGCVHKEILQEFPTLKPLVKLHLSTLDGVPMHAEANGWHWLAKAAGIVEPYQPKESEQICFKYFCEHCRISSVEGAKIVDQIAEKNKQTNKREARELWQQIMEDMRPRWNAEAEAGLKLIETL